MLKSLTKFQHNLDSSFSKCVVSLVMHALKIFKASWKVQLFSASYN